MAIPVCVFFLCFAFLKIEQLHNIIVVVLNSVVDPVVMGIVGVAMVVRMRSCFDVLRLLFLFMVEVGLIVMHPQLVSDVLNFF